jgi:hypothetical protein
MDGICGLVGHRGPPLSIRFCPFISWLEAVVFLLEMISSRQQKPTESSGRSNGSPSGSNGFHLQKAEAKSIGQRVDGPVEAKEMNSQWSRLREELDRIRTWRRRK